MREIDKAHSSLKDIFDLDNKFLNLSKLKNNPASKLSLFEAVLSRRTARSYTEEIVPDEILKEIIEISSHAPSACNEQRWSIILLRDNKKIFELVERGSASFLKNSKNCLVVCYDYRGDNHEWADHIQSGASFIAIFQLVAHAFGIGSCWVGHLPNKSEVKRMLKISKHNEPIGLISFGYYKNKSKWIPRKIDINKVINSDNSENISYKKKLERYTLSRKVLRYFYYKTPVFIRKKLKNFVNKYEKKFYYEISDK